MLVVSFYWFFTRSKAPSSSPPTFTQLTDQPGPELYPSLSPDGKEIVCAAGGRRSAEDELLGAAYSGVPDLGAG